MVRDGDVGMLMPSIVLGSHQPSTACLDLISDVQTDERVVLKLNCAGGYLRPARHGRVVRFDYVFINERGQPFGRMGIGRMIERADGAAGVQFHGRGMGTRRLQHFLGHASITNTVRYTAMSPEPFEDIWR
jgi:integrase